MLDSLGDERLDSEGHRGSGLATGIVTDKVSVEWALFDDGEPAAV